LAGGNVADIAQAMRTQIDVGIFAYCGITDVESHLIYDAEGDHNAPIREQGLQQAHDIASAFLSDHRVIHNAKLEHLQKRG